MYATMNRKKEEWVDHLIFIGGNLHLPLNQKFKFTNGHILHA